MANREKPRQRRIRCSKCGSLFNKDELIRHVEHCGQTSFVEEPQGDLLLDSDTASPMENANLAEARVLPNGDIVAPAKEGEGFYKATTEFILPAAEVQKKVPDIPLQEEDDLLVRPYLPERQVENWPLRHGRISASALGSFLGCPERFRRRYILGMRGPGNGPSLAGGAAHHAVEVAMRYKMAQGEDLPLGLASEAYTQGWEKKRDKELAIEWGNDSEMDWYDRGLAGSQAYLEHIGPTLHPIGSEVMFAKDVAGVAVPVVGFIDVMEEDRCVDLKFGGRKQRSVQNGWRIQGHTYILATEMEMNWHSINWKGEYHTPQDARGLRWPCSAENYAIGAQLVRNTVDAIISFTETYGTDNVWPGALSHPFQCGYCNWREDGCEWWQPQVETI